MKIKELIKRLKEAQKYGATEVKIDLNTDSFQPPVDFKFWRSLGNNPEITLEPERNKK